MVVIGEIIARIAWAADDPYLRFVGAMSAVVLTIVGLAQFAKPTAGGSLPAEIWRWSSATWRRRNNFVWIGGATARVDPFRRTRRTCRRLAWQ